MNSETNDAANLNEDRENEVKVVGEYLRSLSFRERMKGLSPHYRPLKERMRNKTVSYVDLPRPGPPPSRRNHEIKFEASRRLVTKVELIDIVGMLN